MNDKDTKLLEEAYSKLNPRSRYDADFAPGRDIALSGNESLNIDPKLIWAMHDFLLATLGESFKDEFPIKSGFIAAFEKFLSEHGITESNEENDSYYMTKGGDPVKVTRIINTSWN